MLWLKQFEAVETCRQSRRADRPQRQPGAFGLFLPGKTD
jgi:hypothetical protein